MSIKIMDSNEENENRKFAQFKREIKNSSSVDINIS